MRVRIPQQPGQQQQNSRIQKAVESSPPAPGRHLPRAWLPSNPGRLSWGLLSQGESMASDLSVSPRFAHGAPSSLYPISAIKLRGSPNFRQESFLDSQLCDPALQSPWEGPAGSVPPSRSLETAASVHHRSLRRGVSLQSGMEGHSVTRSRLSVQGRERAVWGSEGVQG